MRAILIAAMEAGLETPCHGLPPLVDRPFLQHIVEVIFDLGIGQIELVVDRSPATVQELLRDGSRWGGKCRYHVLRPSQHCYELLKEIPAPDPEEPILLAHWDRLPDLDANAASLVSTTLFCWNERWTSWAVIRAGSLTGIPESASEDQLYDYLASLGDSVQIAQVRKPLNARSYADLVESNRRVLSKEYPNLILTGREVSPGVWISRNVKVHRTARIVPPAFLGENCSIGSLVQVGPAAAIGKNCLIDRETNVSDSVVCQGSYIGEGLELRDVVVDRSRLINTRLNAVVEGVDGLLLGDTSGPSITGWVGRLISRASAAMVFFAGLPFMMMAGLWLAVRGGPVLVRKEAVRGPGVTDPSRWRTFDVLTLGSDPTSVPKPPMRWARHLVFCFLPALWQVALGRLSVVGQVPKSRPELKALSTGGRSEYLASRPGIVSWELLYGPAAEESSPAKARSVKVLSDYFQLVFRGI